MTAVPLSDEQHTAIRAELTRRRTEDLTLRGLLAPADGPRPVPMALGDSVAPAVEWLLAELDRLRAELATARAQVAAVLTVCDTAERQATRWEHPLPVPEWVATVRRAARAAAADALHPN